MGIEKSIEREEQELTVEFMAFCRVLLKLLKLGKVSEAIETLEKIVDNSNR